MQVPRENFVSRLYYMLDNPDFHDAVQWSESDGKPTFLILDPSTFQEKILVSEFRHVNFSSFVRQLNKYDFHKIKFKTPKSRVWEFYHPLFRPENRDKPYLIKRKQLPSRKPKDEKIEPVKYQPEPETFELQSQVANLCTRVSQLEAHNLQLFNVVNMQQDLIERLTKAVELPDLNLPLTYKSHERDTVLIAIDNPQARSILTKILQNLNFAVETLDNGTDLVNRAEANEYRFILVDLILKYLDGVSAIEVIRQSNNDIPILLIMDYSQTESASDYVQRGASAVLYRPFTQNDLSNVLASIQ